MVVVIAADLLFGPWSGGADNVYYAQVFLGPPLVALAFASRYGRSAAWIAAGGVLVAMLAFVVMGFILLGGFGERS